MDKATRDAISITDPTTELGATHSHTSGDEINFVAEEDEIAIYIDPITGRTVKANENIQLNFMIEKKMLNSNRYANLFSGATDSFVWPYFCDAPPFKPRTQIWYSIGRLNHCKPCTLSDLKRAHEMEDDDADSYKRNIYRSFTIGFALIITGIVFCVLGTLLGIAYTTYYCMMAKNKISGAERTNDDIKVAVSTSGVESL